MMDDENKAPDLWAHQVEASDAVVAALEDGRNPLASMATGTGKTFTFVDVVRKYRKPKQRALVLVHRIEIVEQIAESFERAGFSVGIEQGSRRAAFNCQVVVAAVQTMKSSKSRWSRSAFALIVIDEAHHAAANSYRGIVRRFECPVIGFTATPDRLDKKPLGFDCVAIDLNLAESVERGLIVPIVQRSITVDSIDISRVRTQLGDLAVSELEEVLVKVEALQGVAVPMLELIGERKTIAFAASVAHAHALSRVLNRMRPGVAEVVDGGDRPDYRAATLAEFEAGRFQILVNCDLFSEGFDSPSVSCIVMARPTKSRTKYQQCIGRATRLFPGKENALVLDFCGNAGRHDLVTLIDLFARKTDSARVIREAKEIAARDPEKMIAAHVALELARQCTGEVIDGYTVTEERGVDALPKRPKRVHWISCADCMAAVKSGSEVAWGEKTICSHCAWKRNQELQQSGRCGSCGKKARNCLRAGNANICPKCWRAGNIFRTCSRCNESLEGKSYSISFGKRLCAGCEKTSVPGAGIRVDAVRRCESCGTDVSTKSYAVRGGKTVCEPCYAVNRRFDSMSRAASSAAGAYARAAGKQIADPLAVRATARAFHAGMPPAPARKKS